MNRSRRCSPYVMPANQAASWANPEPAWSTEITLPALTQDRHAERQLDVKIEAYNGAGSTPYGERYTRRIILPTGQCGTDIGYIMRDGSQVGFSNYGCQSFVSSQGSQHFARKIVGGEGREALEIFVPASVDKLAVRDPGTGTISYIDARPEPAASPAPSSLSGAKQPAAAKKDASGESFELRQTRDDKEKDKVVKKGGILKEETATLQAIKEQLAELRQQLDGQAKTISDLKAQMREKDAAIAARDKQLKEQQAIIDAHTKETEQARQQQRAQLEEQALQGKIVATLLDKYKAKPTAMKDVDNKTAIMGYTVTREVDGVKSSKVFFFSKGKNLSWASPLFVHNVLGDRKEWSVLTGPLLDRGTKEGACGALNKIAAELCMAYYGTSPKCWKAD